MNALHILSSDYILSGMFMDLLLMCKDFDSKECTITPERRDEIIQTLGHFLTESLYHFTPNQLECMKSSPYLEFYYSVMKQDERLNVHNNCKECTPCTHYVCVHTCDCKYPYENCTHPIKLELEQSNVHNNCEECACDTDTSNTSNTSNRYSECTYM